MATGIVGNARVRERVAFSATIQGIAPGAKATASATGVRAMAGINVLHVKEAIFVARAMEAERFTDLAVIGHAHLVKAVVNVSGVTKMACATVLSVTRRATVQSAMAQATVKNAGAMPFASYALTVTDAAKTVRARDTFGSCQETALAETGAAVTTAESAKRVVAQESVQTSFHATISNCIVREVAFASLVAEQDSCMISECTIDAHIATRKSTTT